MVARTANGNAVAFAFAVGLGAGVFVFDRFYSLPDNAPQAFRIALGLFFGSASAYAVGDWIYKLIEKRRHEREAAQEAQSDKAAQARRRELGRYADIVESTSAAVRALAESEAARKGWIGNDVNFDPDIKVIVEKFRKARDLQKVADKLSALHNPTFEDRELLSEAKATIGQLESVARKRAELIAKCATEAELIDKSLKQERADAKTAEQRAELHAELSGMLYGITATPDTASLDSAAADGVMARVQAYREIKNQLQLVRDETHRP